MNILTRLFHRKKKDTEETPKETPEQHERFQDYATTHIDAMALMQEELTASEEALTAVAKESRKQERQRSNERRSTGAFVLLSEKFSKARRTRLNGNGSKPHSALGD